MQNLTVIGVGGGGSNITETLFKSGFSASYTIISCPERSDLPESIDFISYNSMQRDFYQKEVFTFNVESFPNTHTLNLSSDIWYLLFKAKELCLITSPGGFTGTFFMNTILEELHRQKKKYSLFGGFPFSFEGEKRKLVAEWLYERYTPEYFLNYDSVREKYGNISLADAFSKCDEELVMAIRNYYKSSDK